MAAQPTVTAAVQTAIDNWTRRHRTTLGVSFGGPVLLAIFLAYFTSVSLTPLAVVLLIPIVWVVQWLFRIGWWVAQRRVTLARRSTAMPGPLQTWRDYRTVQKRIKKTQSQFAAYCTAKKVLNFWGVPPRLSLKANEDLDLIAYIPAGATGLKYGSSFGIDALRKAAPEIAQTCGCPGGVRVQQTSFAHAKLTFMWSNLLERELSVVDSPAGPYNRIGYGITHGPSGMSIKMGLSTFIIGNTGSGKSKTLRSLLIDLARRNVPTELYPIDPKKQELAKFARLVGQSRRSLAFKAYANSVEEASTLILDLDAQMKQRQQEMGDEDIDEWEEKYADRWPLILCPIDEVFELLLQFKPDPRTKVNPKDVLLGILSQGRASGVMVVMLSQVANKEILGIARSLVKQRIVMEMESPLETGMAFGDMNAEDKGALCSLIREPGMGFAWSADERGYTPVRVAMCSNEHWKQFLNTGELPEGMLEGKAVIPEQYYNYRFYTADRQPLRTGITNNFDRRYKEYQADYEKERAALEAGWLDPAKALHQWFQYHDKNQTIITEARDKAEAKSIESAFIATGVWRGNHQENMRSELRNVAPPIEQKTRKMRRSERHEDAESARLPVPVPAASRRSAKQDPAPSRRDNVTALSDRRRRTPPTRRRSA